MAKKTTKKAAKSTKKAARKSTKSGAKTSAAGKPAKAPTALTGEVEYLMEMMVANGVTEVDIDDGKRRIALKRGTYTPAAVAAPAPVTAPAAPAPTAAAPAEKAEAPAEPSEKLLEITSPMVGTFYAAPSPDSDAFVKVGDSVGDDTVVCIVEAMKVMNEIKAECSGTIAEICVKNAEPVEFGQVLFRVKP